MKTAVIALSACALLVGCGGGSGGSGDYLPEYLEEGGDLPPDDVVPPDVNPPPDDVPPADDLTPPDDISSPDDNPSPGDVPPPDDSPPEPVVDEPPGDDGNDGNDDGGDIDNGGDGDDSGGNDGDNGGDDSEEEGSPDCDYSYVDELWAPQENPVWYFNAKFYGNRTARWRNGAIRVRVSDERVDLDALQMIFDELNSFIRPANLIIFGGNAPNHHIVIRRNSDWQEWGGALWQGNGDNEINSAVIELGEFEEIDCHFYAVLKHNLIQSLGFFDYTQDGGVMTQEIYNDLVTVIVKETLEALYDMPAGIEVEP